MPPLSPQSLNPDDIHVAEQFEQSNDIPTENIVSENNNLIVPANSKKSRTSHFAAKYLSVSPGGPGTQVRFIYDTHGSPIVWRNIILFAILHSIYVYSFYVCLVYKCWYTWIFSKSRERKEKKRKKRMRRRNEKQEKFEENQ